MTERAVERDDIERYRRALKELGGSASIEKVAERAGTGETDLDYVVACLIVPEPTAQDPDVVPPFALPGAMDAKVWRTEPHWTADDLEAARRFLAPEEATDDHDTRNLTPSPRTAPNGRPTTSARSHPLSVGTPTLPRQVVPVSARKD